MPLPGQRSAYGTRYTRLVGETGDVAIIEPASGSLRTSLYDKRGVALKQAPHGTFIRPVQIRQTTAAAAGTTVWAMTNVTAAPFFKQIRHIHLQMAFDGTVTAATTVRYHLCRGAGAVPTLGTSILEGRRDTLQGGYPDDARYLNTGLDTTGITFSALFWVIGLPLTASVVGIPIAATIITPPIAVHDLRFGDANDPLGGFMLRENESLCIRVGGLVGPDPTVVGISLTGYVLYEDVELG